MVDLVSPGFCRIFVSTTGLGTSLEARKVFFLVIWLRGVGEGLGKGWGGAGKVWGLGKGWGLAFSCFKSPVGQKSFTNPSAFKA